MNSGENGFISSARHTRIGGVKLSNELTQISIVSLDGYKDLEARVSRILASRQLNMVLLIGVCLEESSKVSFCVAARNTKAVEDLLGTGILPNCQVDVISRVGFLSLFPYQYSLGILGLSLVAFGEACIPIYSMSSSLSSLTFVTDYILLDEAVKSLESYFDLPPNHAPLRVVG